MKEKYDCKEICGMRTVRELRALTIATGLLWFTVNVGWSPHSQEHHVIGCQERNEGSLFQENYLQSYSLHLTRIPIEYHTEKRMRTLKYFKINIIPLHVLLSVFPVLILKLTRQNENNFRKNKIKSFQIGNALISQLLLKFQLLNPITLKYLPLLLLWDTIGLKPQQ